MKDQSKFPPGWDEERVRRVLEHYKGQSDAAAAAEDEAAFAEQGQTVMVIPNELVPAVRTLLAGHSGGWERGQMEMRTDDENSHAEFLAELRASAQEERAERRRNTWWMIGFIFAATALWVAVVKMIE